MREPFHGHLVEYGVILKLFALHKKESFPIRISSGNVTKSAVFADLVTFTKEIFNGKLNFFCVVLFLPNIGTADTKIDFNFEGKGANDFDS